MNKSCKNQREDVTIDGHRDNVRDGNRLVSRNKLWPYHLSCYKMVLGF